jgi:hypothetical protein
VPGRVRSDYLYGLAVDAPGNAHVTCLTNGQSFPVKDVPQSQLGNGVCELGISPASRLCDIFLGNVARMQRRYSEAKQYTARAWRSPPKYSIPEP